MHRIYYFIKQHKKHRPYSIDYLYSRNSSCPSHLSDPLVLSICTFVCVGLSPLSVVRRCLLINHSHQARYTTPWLIDSIIQLGNHLVCLGISCRPTSRPVEGIPRSTINPTSYDFLRLQAPPHSHANQPYGFCCEVFSGQSFTGQIYKGYENRTRALICFHLVGLFTHITQPEYVYGDI